MYLILKLSYAENGFIKILRIQNFFGLLEDFDFVHTNIAVLNNHYVHLLA